jgi:hypothetical protein
MNKWIDVNKYKPEYNKRVLVVLDGTMINNGKLEDGKNKPYESYITVGWLTKDVSKDKEYFAAYSNNYTACFYSDAQGALVHGIVTHWMYLPELPNVER